jgi:hypothetical protein
MATYTDNEKALIVEMVIDRLQRLVLDFPEDGPARERQHQLLLRIVAGLDADDPTNPTLERLVDECIVIHSPRSTEPTDEPVPAEMSGGAAVDSGAAVIVSDNEEEVEEERAEQEETAVVGTEAGEAEEGDIPSGFAFPPNVLFRPDEALVFSNDEEKVEEEGAEQEETAATGTEEVETEKVKDPPGFAFQHNVMYRTDEALVFGDREEEAKEEGAEQEETAEEEEAAEGEDPSGFALQPTDMFHPDEALVFSDDADEVEEEREEQEETAGRGTEEQEAEEEDGPSGFAFQPNVMYPSSLAMVGNHLVAVGHGYSANAGGRRRYYTAAGSGIRHDMNRAAPGKCYNCGENHWRAYCPFACGKSILK